MRAYSNVVFLVSLLFIIALPQLRLCGTSTTSYTMVEQQVLQNLKESFSNSSMFVSCEGNNHCQWEGGECDGIAGHVTKLVLHWQETCTCHRFICKCSSQGANGVPTSILELKHLNSLELTGITFGGSSIPAFFSSMKQLTYLNLSNCDFSGKVPHQLGNLSNLQTLDVSGNPLVVDDMTWLSRLSSLKHLAMNGVDLGEAYNLLQVLDMLPFLLQVEFSGCDLITNMHFSTSHVSSMFLAKVQVLNLAENLLSDPIPDAFKNLTSIQSLNIGYNNLTSLPYWLINLDSLANLNLSGNPFKRFEASMLSILTNALSPIIRLVI